MSPRHRRSPFGENVGTRSDHDIGFLYGDVPDASEFLRTARSVWLEIKSDNVDEMIRKIVESGLVRKLEVPDPHLYFQAPRGQRLRLVGIDEDMSFYEEAGAGPDVAKVNNDGIATSGAPRGSSRLARKTKNTGRKSQVENCAGISLTALTD